MTITPTTFNEWINEGYNGSQTIDIDYKINIYGKIVEHLKQDVVNALTAENISDIPNMEIKWEPHDFIMDVTVEVAFKKLSSNKIKAFVNYVECS